MWNVRVSNWSELDGVKSNLFTIERDISEDLLEISKIFAFKDIDFRVKNLRDVELLKINNLLKLDIKDIFTKFSEFFNFCNSFEYRVQSHKQDSCRLFHYDEVYSRMIVTYYGLGTEVVNPDNINWDQIGSEWSDFEEYNCKVLKNREEVDVLEIGSIHILYGNTSGKVPCIHRAPNIEDRGLRRLTAIATAYL